MRLKETALGGNKKLTIVTVSSEMVPYAKTGGLADVAGTLPTVLSELGHTCYSFLPLYKKVKEEWNARAEKFSEFSIPISGQNELATIWQYEPQKNHTVFFVENNNYFDRDGIYGTSKGDFPDNGARFGFFCQAVLETLRSAALARPDIIHCHDWQSSLIPVYLKENFPTDKCFKSTKTLLTIHNMAYQGLFDKKILTEIGLPESLAGIQKMEFWGRVNLLKGGLVYADAVNTVSPTYAKEILGSEYGSGLDGVLKSRKDVVHGVLNGLDLDEWNPDTDSLLWKKYSAKTLEGKAENKRRLQWERELEVTSEHALIGMVTRLADQKGLDILMEALPRILELPVQLIILGMGDQVYHDRLSELHDQYNDRVSIEIGFDNQLAHRIYAGSDVFLMPSRFEPCGLGQLISFRYGTVPIVRRTGGLADTVTDVAENVRGGTGFVFSDYSASALYDAVRRASEVFQDQNAWERLIQRAMKLDFSWKKSASSYVGLYKSLLRPVEMKRTSLKSSC